MQLKYKKFTYRCIYVQVKLNSHLKEKNREDDDDEIEAKISEDDGEDSKEINQKGQEQKFLLSENTDDGQGTNFYENFFLIN